MRRRDLLVGCATVFGVSVSGCAARTGEPLVVSSPAFDDGDALPERFGCSGAGVSPPLVIESVPEPTAALAVVGRSTVGVLSNPTLWTLWNVPPETTRIPEDVPRTPTVATLGDARQGQRSTGPVGYRPPCPPRGQPYDHWFQVYALEAQLALPAGATHERAVEAIESNTLASDRLTVSYTRRDES
jgi:Raf kinase inhibitor-like YbhB/YbcL family protein